MTRVSALLGCALLCAAQARGQQAVDLAWQFPDPPTRDQGDIGACHAFGSVALIEAALHRRYEKPGASSTVRLSDADLFVMRTVSDKKYFARAKGLLELKAYPFGVFAFGSEGGDFEPNLKFAIDHGVAPEKYVPWARVSKGYLEYRKRLGEDLASKFQACGIMSDVSLSQNIARSEAVTAGMKQASETPDLPKSDGLVGTPRFELVGAQLERQACERRTEMMKGVVAYIDERAGKGNLAAAGEILGDDPEIAKQRDVVRVLLTNFDRKVHIADGKVLEEIKKNELSDDSFPCPLERLAPVKRLVRAYLDRGVPVGLGMSVGGLKEWDSEAPGSGYRHIFVLSGYAADGGGRLTFKTRNSWGGKNPDVPEDRLCRVNSIGVALTPTEKAEKSPEGWK